VGSGGWAGPGDAAVASAWRGRKGKREKNEKATDGWVCLLRLLPSGCLSRRIPSRVGTVPVWAGTKPAQIQNLNLNSKK